MKRLGHTKILLATNLITAGIAMWFFFRHGYHEKIYKKIKGEQSAWSRNENYSEQTDIYGMYELPKDIVMLGTSQTYRVNWGELLDRKDIANRGIEGDITSGFLERMNFVLRLEPKICFVEGGINDLRIGEEPDSILLNLEKIGNILLANAIIPVFITVPYVTEQFPNAITFNSRIKMLNEGIRKMTSGKKITLLNLNTHLSKDEFLDPRFAANDGIHLGSQAYLIWKEEVKGILEAKGI